MTRLSCALAGRIRGSIQQWFRSRMYECVHCWQCDGDVTPWDTCCPICGQRNPVRLSPSAGVSLVLGFLVLAIVLSALVLAL